MNRFRQDELIVLLGAGASVEAGIPHSTQMIDRLEELIAAATDEWGDHAGLYRYVKSAVLFADGLKGRFDTRNYNVERLVETLEELLKKDDHPLFPFVGAWNPKLVEVTGGDFTKVQRLRNAIVKELRDKWIPLGRTEKAEYYCGLLRLQSQYQHPLRIFSLNYDMCLEEWHRRQKGYGPQLGFEERRWNWRLLAQADADITSEDDLIYLYKLHGSVNWSIDRQGNGSLTCTDNPSTIELENLAVIFGTSYKLQYADPFLFLAYEFRRWSLEARVILSIGYGFADPHVNEIVGQALRASEDRILVTVSPLTEGHSRDAEVKRIEEALGVKGRQQIVHEPVGAKVFLEGIDIKRLEEHMRGKGDDLDELS